MPGTVPKATDPILVTTSPSTNTSTPALVKATLDSDPDKANLLTTSLPAGHPTAGVASTGAAQLVAASSATSQIAPTNSPAIIMSKSQSTPTSKKSGQGKKKASKTAVGGENAELLKFVETNGHFSLVRNFHLADAFTLMNGFCGAQSLFASARYLITSDPRHAWTALWFPLFGAIFDLLDGKVARWRNSSSMLGQELDSLADSVRWYDTGIISSD